MRTSKDVPVPDLGAPSADELAHTGGDVARFVAGEERAFHDLWVRFQPALEVQLAGRFRSCLDPRLRHRLDSEIDDILQEASMVILTGLRRFQYRGPGSLLAWMSVIALRTAKDRVAFWKAEKRDARRQQSLAREGSSSDPPRAPAKRVLKDTRPGPVSEADRAEERRDIADVLASLSKRHHQIVLLRFFAGADWAEIAQQVGSRTADAVKKECFIKVLPAVAAALSRKRR